MQTGEKAELMLLLVLKTFRVLPPFPPDVGLLCKIIQIALPSYLLVSLRTASGLLTLSSPSSSVSLFCFSSRCSVLCDGEVK